VALASEGWEWIEAATDVPNGYSHGLLRLAGDPELMTDEDSAAQASLLAEYRGLEEEYSGQDEYPEEIDAPLSLLETAMESFEQRPLIYDPAEVARAGVFVTLDRDGSLAVYHGHVRPEDEPREVTAVQGGDCADAVGQGGGDLGVSNWKPSATSAGGTIVTLCGQPIVADLSKEEDEGALKPLSERLVMELTAHRTLALREAIGRSPDGAMTLLLMKLVTDTFRISSDSGCCLEASVRQVDMSAQAADLRDIVVAKLVD
jgi:ParB family chromosome partitioning protein